MGHNVVILAILYPFASLKDQSNYVVVVIFEAFGFKKRWLDIGHSTAIDHVTCEAILVV